MVTRLAQRMPLSHFPASTRFSDWRSWPELKSARVRALEAGVPLPPDPTRHPEFKALEDEHVFTFAGPCAYTRKKALGDAALWLHPSVEKGATGDASPFDTGALEHGYLRPWDARGDAERWSFFEKTRAPIARWRDEFAGWLSSAYRDPKRYLETDKGRHASGDPDGTDPHGVFAENGTRHPAGNDRRAWTWEVRLAGRVSLDHTQALLIPRRLAQDARVWRLGRKGPRKVELFFLTRNTAVAADDVFRESGRVCRKLFGLR